MIKAWVKQYTRPPFIFHLKPGHLPNYSKMLWWHALFSVIILILFQVMCLGTWSERGQLSQTCRETAFFSLSPRIFIPCIKSLRLKVKYLIVNLNSLLLQSPLMWVFRFPPQMLQWSLWCCGISGSQRMHPQDGSQLFGARPSFPN